MSETPTPPIRSKKRPIVDLDKLQEGLDAETLRKNTLTVAEFSRYMPLYKTTGVEELGPAEYDKVASEYRFRISMYHEIKVVTSNYQYSLDEDDIVMRLPPMFTRVSPLNDVPGLDAAELVSTFSNNLDRGSQFNTLEEEGFSMMHNALTKALDPNKVAKASAEFKAIADEFYAGQTTATVADAGVTPEVIVSGEEDDLDEVSFD